MAKLSNTSSTTTQRKSYLLSVTPVEYSLTEGTNIPAPERSPSRASAADIAPPPTPGRGPLNSHPTTPPNGESEMKLDAPAPSRTKAHTNGAPADRIMSSDGADSTFRKPSSPASAAQYSSSSPQQARRPSSVRKLLSLGNLRNSFSSSRTSLAMPRSSNDTHHSTHNQQPTAQSNYSPSLKRPSSPSMASTTASTTGHHERQNHPPLRTKKSGGNWFKRKSGLFMLNGNGELDSVAEDNSYRPDTRESKRVKPSGAGTGGAETVVNRVPQAQPERKATPPPLIPEIGRGSFSGGDLGWDEAAFRR